MTKRNLDIREDGLSVQGTKRRILAKHVQGIHAAVLISGGHSPDEGVLRHPFVQGADGEFAATSAGKGLTRTIHGECARLPNTSGRDEAAGPLKELVRTQGRCVAFLRMKCRRCEDRHE